MNEAQARRFFTSALAELDDAETARKEAFRRMMALKKTVDGIADLFPDMTARVLEERQRSRKKGGGPVEAEPEEGDGPAAQSVGAAVEQVFEEHPKKWLTARQLAAAEPVAALKLSDPEPSIRAALRRMNGRIERKNLDGRTRAFRLSPQHTASGQQHLGEGG